MKPASLALLFLFLFLGSACLPTIEPHLSKHPALELHFDEDETKPSGQWTIMNLSEQQLGRSERIDLHLRVSRRNATFLYGHLQADDLSLHLAPAGEPLKLQRDAGTLVLQRSDADLKGPFSIQPNPEFQSLAQTLSGSPMDRMTLVNAIIRNIPLSTLKSYQDLSIDLSGDNLWSLINRRVDAEYVHAVLQSLPTASIDDILLLKRSAFGADDIASYAGFTAPEMIRLKRSGVRPSDVRAYKEFNPEFQPDDYIMLKRAGVPSEWAHSLKGLTKIQSANDLVALRRAGVNPDFIKAGLSHAFVTGADDLIALRRAGVSPDFLSDLRWLDDAVTSNDIIQLRRMGISATYHNAMRQYGAYSIDSIIHMKRRGVPVEFVQASHVPGKPPLTVDAIIDLRNRGVSPETVRELRN